MQDGSIKYLDLNVSPDEYRKKFAKTKTDDLIEGIPDKIKEVAGKQLLKKAGYVFVAPEQVITGDSKDARPLAEIPLTEEQRAIGKSIPQTSAKDAYEEQYQRLSGALGVIEGIASPLTDAPKGVIEGVKRIGEGGSEIARGKVGEGLLDVGLGVVEAGFSAGTVTSPVLAAINLGFKGGGVILPEKAMEYVGMPVTTTIKDLPQNVKEQLLGEDATQVIDKFADTELGKKSLEALDVVAQVAGFKGAGKLAKGLSTKAEIARAKLRDANGKFVAKQTETPQVKPIEQPIEKPIETAKPETKVAIPEENVQSLPKAEITEQKPSKTQQSEAPLKTEPILEQPKVDKGQLEINQAEAGFAKPTESRIPVSQEPMAKLIKASEIISNVEKDLGVPIRIGKVVGKKRVGVFKIQPEVVRLKEANDLATMSHEIAHFIDKKMLKGFKQEGAQRFYKWRSELKELDYDQTKKRSSEGFAEFVRHYLTDNEAQKLAPKFYDYFIKDFLPNNPELQKTIETARTSITQWREQGSLSRVISQIDFDGKKTDLSVKEKLTNLKLKVQSKFTNQLEPIKYVVDQVLKGQETKLRPSENPYEIAMSIQKTAGAKAREFVMNGAFDFATNKVGKSLKEIVLPVGGNIENAIAYAYSKHAKSLIERGVNPGISLEDANYVLKNYAKPEYKSFATEFTNWSNHLLDYLIDAGGLSAEGKVRMREVNPFYIPLKRAFADKGISTPKGKGFVDLPSAIKRIKGSGREVINPLESMIAQTEQIISIADKTRVARALANMTDKYEGIGKWVEKVPAPIEGKLIELEKIKKQIEDVGGDLSKADLESMISIFSQGKNVGGKDNIVSIFRNGKREYFQLDPNLYDAMKGLDNTTLPWFLDITFGKANRAVRLGATGVRAGFTLITNPIRDAQTFFLQSEHTGIRPDKIAKAIIEEFRGKSEYAREFRRAGGEMAQPLGLDRKMMQNTVNEILADNVKSKTLNVVKHPIEALREVLSFPEAGTRLAEFESVMEKYKPRIEEAKSKGDLREIKKLQEDATVEASNAANEVTVNFKRAGSYGAILNQIIPFFNPAIQGVSRMGRTIYEHPVRSGLRATALLTAPTMALWMINKDEDWYKNLPDWQKYAFWNFKVGDNIVRLPKPFEWGYVFAGIPEGVANSIYHNNPEYVGGAIKEAVLTAAPDVVPALIKPAMENYFNWDMFRERPLVSKGQEGLLPPQQYNSYTSGIAKTLGGILNVSPIKIDHLLSGYSGGLVSDILNGLPKEYKESADIPVIGRLFTRGSSVGFGGENVKKFYEAYTKVQSIGKTISNIKKYGNLIDFSNEDKIYYGMKDIINRTAEDLRILRDAQIKLNQTNYDSGIKQKINLSIGQAAAKRAEQTVGMLNRALKKK